MKRVLHGIGLALAVGLGNAALAQQAPALLQLFAGPLGQELTQVGSIPLAFENGAFFLDEPLTIETAEFTITASAIGKFDPALLIHYGVIDLGNPTVFGVVATIPILPLTGTTLIRSSLTGDLLDAGGDGIFVLPLIGTAIQHSSLDAVFMDVSLGPAFTAPPLAPDTVYSYTHFNPGPSVADFVAGPTGSFSSLTVANAFLLSGFGDRVVLTGFTEVVAVPEPASAAVTGVGLLVLAWVCWCRRSPLTA